MNAEREVPTGYKRSEVGRIPNDWACTHLGDVARVSAGGTPSRAVGAYWNGDIPWVTTREVDFCRINATAEHITILGVKNSAAKPLPAGTLLLALYGQGKTRGKVAILGICAATNQACAAIELRDGLLQRFVFHQLAGRYEEIRQLSNNGNQENLNGALVRSIPLALPPVDEQRAIADALGDVDALLDALDRQIAKQRDLKQAAMQQLLTGRTRLPGFTGEWQHKSLRDIVSMPITDGPHLTPKFLDQGIPFLSVNNLVDNKLSFTDLRFVSRADHEEFAKKCRPQRGDILFGKAASVGQVALIDTDRELNIWSPLALIRPGNTALPQFVVFALQTREVRRQIGLLTNSSSQGNIGMGEIGQIVIPIPDRDEQASIAAVLSDMDAEITALESRRGKTRDLKQAMLQELLTGRTRLM